MGQETFQLIQKLNIKEFELQMIMQCAPVLAGDKISNLFITSKGNETILKQYLQNTGFQFYQLFETNQKDTYLIFNHVELEKYLKFNEVKDVFECYGYDNTNIEYIFKKFRTRYQQYMVNHYVFPHEMGLLLGYPVEDVRGFIENKGKNFLYSGYWKVYDNMQEKIELFHRYEASMSEQIEMLSNGITLCEIINYYKEDVKEIIKVS